MQDSDDKWYQSENKDKDDDRITQSEQNLDKESKDLLEIPPNDKDLKHDLSGNEAHDNKENIKMRKDISKKMNTSNSDYVDNTKGNNNENKENKNDVDDLAFQLDDLINEAETTSKEEVEMDSTG